MKKLLILFFIAVLSFSCKSKTKRILVEKKQCVVVNVQYFPIGSIHTLQTDAKFHATTDCGVKISLNHYVSVGDTLTFETYHIE